MLLKPTPSRLAFIFPLFLAAVLASECALSAPAPAPKALDTKGEWLNFREVDIRTVISSIGKITGKNFLIDPRVNGKITIISATPLHKESVYTVFLDALRTQNYVAIEQGDVIKIVPLEEAKRNPASTSHIYPGGAEQITRVVKIKNIAALQLAPVLQQLMPKDASLLASMDTNSLIISDSKQNMQRLLEIIKIMDKPSQDSDVIVPLYQANADEVLRILKETQPKKSETSAVVTADKRSNSIIISGNKGERERYLRVIKNLDIPVNSHSTHHVIALKYAKAADLAPLLDKVLGRSGVSGSSAAASAAPQTAGVNLAATNIIADEATNSLIISADIQSFRLISDILKQLDIPRKQVLIEAIIAEVSMDNTRKFGIEWSVAQKNNSAGAANSPQGSSGLLSVVSSLANSDLSKALLTGGFSALISKGDISIMLNAIKNDANVNILSAPQILTLNNKKAEMIVGENVPFITGSYNLPTTASATPAGGAVTNPFTTIQRQDVGLKLIVTPQINQGGMISLEIEQETSAVKDTTSNAGITTTKRSMKSNVLVANGNMLVLGGLMNDQINDGVDSLPLLGDIPLLGWLFKTQKTTATKRTLMVFIRPTIVDAEANNNPTQKALLSVEHEQKMFNKKDLLLTPEAKRFQITPPVEVKPELDSEPKAVAE